MAWETDQVQMLEKLWKDGLSASQIARELGGGVTRNAVIGKVHRMGFADRGLPSRGGNSGGRKSSPEAVAAARGSGSAHKGSRAGSGKSASSSLPPPVPQLKPADEDVRVLDLADHKCRWPMGDPQDKDNFRFCGARKVSAEKVYCDYHTHVAYQRSNRVLAAQGEQEPQGSQGSQESQESKAAARKPAKRSSGG